MTTFGERAKQRARKRGLSDSEVARRCGLKQQTYSAYVNDTRKPNSATLIKISKALLSSPDELLGIVEFDIPA